MKRRKLTISIVLFVGLLFILIGMVLSKTKSRYSAEIYSTDYVAVKEVIEELRFSSYQTKDWETFFEVYHKEYLTYDMAEQLLGELGVSDYIEQKKRAKGGAIDRNTWNILYQEILSYLDLNQEVTISTILIMDFIDADEGIILVTNEGEWKTNLPKTYFELWNAYDSYLMNGTCTGIIAQSEEENAANNAYLKSYSENTADFLFGGSEYKIEFQQADNQLLPGICDFIFENGALKTIRTKSDTIQGKLLSYDDSSIEIEGYGKLNHTGKIPVYQNFDGISEKSISNVVLGNMEAQYIIGENEVCAIVMNAPAVIENIRVLLLAEDGTKFRTNAFLKCDSDFLIRTGETETTYEAGNVIDTTQFLENQSQTVTLAPMQDNAKVYICDENGTATSNGYHGTMEVRWYEDGYTMVNSVPFETYLYAVVPSEMPSSYQMEALKAQAICARSYAYMQLIRADLSAYGAHINDSTSYQVYNKVAESEQSKLAVDETNSLVMTYQGNVIEAYYFSTSMGYTDTAEIWNPEDMSKYGYLKKVCLNQEEFSGDLSSENDFKTYIESEQVGYDSEIKFYRWKVKADFTGKEEEIKAVLTNRRSISPRNVIYYDSDEKTEQESMEQFGKLVTVSVAERSDSGSILTLRLQYKKGVVLVKSEYNIRKVLGTGAFLITYADGSESDTITLLPCAACTVEKNADGSYLLSGGGYGHGLGMSQNGANGLAKDGKTCDEILSFFYHEVMIESLNELL